MVAVLCALTLLACREFDAPEAEQSLPDRVNISIAHLREMVGERTVHFEQDLEICVDGRAGKAIVKCK